MRSDEQTKSDRTSVITAACYVVTLLAVMGLTFWLTRMMVVEVAQHMKLIYPVYGL